MAIPWITHNVISFSISLYLLVTFLQPCIFLAWGENQWYPVCRIRLRKNKKKIGEIRVCSNGDKVDQKLSSSSYGTACHEWQSQFLPGTVRNHLPVTSPYIQIVEVLNSVSPTRKPGTTRCSRLRVNFRANSGWLQSFILRIQFLNLLLEYEQMPKFD